MAILCATDFSNSSRFACDGAAALARKSKETLVLLHVVAEGDGASRGEVVNALHSIAADLRSSGAAVEERVEPGDPAAVIARVAEEIGAALIVLAPATDIGRRHFGGTADHVLSRATVPVLVIRDGFPAESWTRGERPLRVAVAIDLSPISDNAVSWAAALEQYGPIELTALHVEWPAEAYERMGIESPMALDRTHPAVEQLIKREIETASRKMSRQGRDVTVMTEPSSDKPAQGITRMAAAAGADLLVIGNRSARAWRVWEKSVGRAVVWDASISVAGVPDLDVAASVESATILRTLAATDLSPHGNAAVGYALSLAPPRSSIVIVHVLDRDELPPEERKRITEGLSAIAKRRDLVERHVEVRVELLTSDDPARAINDFAEEWDAGLVCVAARGRSRLPRFMLGSTVQKVLLFSRRPVLVVP